MLRRLLLILAAFVTIAAVAGASVIVSGPHWSTDEFKKIQSLSIASLPAPKPKEQNYTVQSGDTLSKISKQFYGDANRYMKIFDANKDQLKDPNTIKPGQVLRIPAA